MKKIQLEGRLYAIVLEHYEVRRGGPGLMCGTRCVTMNAWCSGGSFPCANLGAGITSDSEIICNNHTLWRNLTCYNYVGPGTRCSGLKQCAYPTTSLYRLVSRDCSDPYPGVNQASLHTTAFVEK